MMCVGSASCAGEPCGHDAKGRGRVRVAGVRGRRARELLTKMPVEETEGISAVRGRQ